MSDTEIAKVDTSSKPKRRGSAPGERRGGRTKGTPNKLNASVKQSIAKAFEEVGGARYLVAVAKEDPRTFCALLGKIVPTEIEGGDKPIKTILEVIWASSNAKQ